ncbi:type II toxin-antitoxin system RelE/ParE family toxin [Paraburkholderia strydomiana]|uniref:type II toxin-antitoxin system RelE/ParE family toxin n=1 Tax=Paraburkholderia strydomiana TaxID=1245417 RepID=UPI0038BDDB60
MTYRVQFAPEARDQLKDIERFISEAGSPVTAAQYVDAIISFCLRLQTFPERGVPRPGNRLSPIRWNTTTDDARAPRHRPERSARNRRVSRRARQAIEKHGQME